MVKKITTLILFFATTIFAANLYSRTEPFETGHLKVSEIHSIYYEASGNSDGIPVFVLHGGPGGSSRPGMHRYFDPETHLTVIHDQRGCGESTPYGEIRENTTWTLVEDIEKLRNHFKLGKISIYGASWGTTLGLAYAQTYPKNVNKMVLCGTFTSTKEEINHYYYGDVEKFYPEAYNELKSVLPSKYKKITPKILYELIKTKDIEEDGKYSKAWAQYEFSIARVDPTGVDMYEYWDYSSRARTLFYTLGLFENYYLANKCFMKEGQLLKNAHRIEDIPITFINGRHDMICPPRASYNLHKLLPNSKLIIVENTGHSMSEEGAFDELMDALSEL